MFSSSSSDANVHTGRGVTLDSTAMARYLENRSNSVEALDVFGKSLCIHLVQSYALDVWYSERCQARPDTQLLAMFGELLPAYTILPAVSSLRYSAVELALTPSRIILLELKR